MRRICGTVQQVFALLDPPATAITIATDDEAHIVAIAAGDLALALWGLRCGTAIDAEIDAGADIEKPRLIVDSLDF